LRAALIAPLATLALTACGPSTFTTEVKGEGVVPGSALGGLLTAFPSLGSLTAIDFDENQDFKTNKTARENVASLKVEAFSLKILEPSNQDMSLFDSVDVLGKAGDIEIPIASKSGITQLMLKAPNPTLVFDVTNEELVTLLRAPTMSLVLRGRGRQPPADTRLEAKAKLRVGVKL
jgi:hypothetical protein